MFAATLPKPGTPPAGVKPAGGPTAGTPGGVVPAGGSVAPATAQAPGRPSPGVQAGGAPVAPPKPATPTTAQVPGRPSPAAPAAPKTAAAPAAVNPQKAAALKLMAEGKQLADQGDFAGAHAKYKEADKYRAAFGDNEYSPGLALQELSARGVAAIDRLVKEAQGQVAKKDYARAEAALAAASEIATALTLFPRPIEEARTALRKASGGKFGGPDPAVAKAPPVKPATPTGPSPVQAQAPVQAQGRPSLGVPSAPPGVATIGTPSAPPGVATIGTPAAPATPPTMPPVTPAVEVAVAPAPVPVDKPATPGTVTGRQLLDQAALEFRKGDFDLARRLALQAHNLGGSQDEARGLLNQIDAEVFAGKQRTAAKSFAAAVEAAKNKDHGHALGVLVLIDPNLLPKDVQKQREELIAACKAEVDKTAGPKGDAVVTTAGTQPPMTPEPPITPVPGTGSDAPLPGTARVGTGTDPKAANPDALTNQLGSMKQVAFQKLRSEGLKVQADAQAAFGRGETDTAIHMLADYGTRVRAANLEPASVALLMRPIDSRMEMFRLMKGQADALTREKKDKKELKELIATGRGPADEQRKAEVQKLVRQFHALVRDSKFAEAEKVALQAKQLEPDDPAISTLAYMAKMQRRVKDAEKLKSDREELVLKGLNGAERQGPYVDTDDPVSFRLDAARRAKGRGTLDDAYLRSRTPAEFDIEMKLDRPVSVDFTQTPLKAVIEDIQQLTGLPFSWDTTSLEQEGVSQAKPITEKLPNISARNALYLILDKAGLSFVIEYDTVRITTMKKAKGRQFTKVFSVADLVTPVPNFALPAYANFDKMITRSALDSPQAVIGGLTPGTSAGVPGGLGGGTAPAGVGATTPGIAGGLNFGGGGSLENNPLNRSANLASDRGTKHEQLIKLVTSMIRPYSWDGMGGNGKIEYFDLGSALVVNQTADVIREIQDLLEALRRLQDLAVAVEVRIISLSETWFERMGVDFAMNVKTHNTSFEPGLVSSTFRPEPFINDINREGTTIGLTPAGSFTPDLDVPIRATSFNYAIPGFGGYPNAPGMNGGLSLGLAFLNDIQVYMFMEAAQGDRRVNVMQAPKLTLFNGQTATISVNDLQFFVTQVQVFSVNGQIVFIPQNTPLPGPGQQGINLSLQAVVSADRRFVRINIPVQLSVQTGATVPLFPVTTFVTPVFEGGSQGLPIPFTQFLQQPSFSNLNIQTTVVCPDGGTVLLGGLKTLGEGRNEFGPPFFSKVPYLNRLVKNVGIGRETTHIMIMVTPRIIINAEEEIVQTEGGGPLGTRPGQ
jgi:type II secretory pathway component GspD/PulD (secretin)